MLIQDYLDICDPVLTFDRFMGEGELYPFLCNITTITSISKRTHEKTLVFSHAHLYNNYFLCVTGGRSQ